MVVFTCSECGDAVKKPQVEKHQYNRRCKGATLSCVDCFKDFYGTEYQSHNSCMTENQRYGGKNFVAKENQNKGQMKQQQWYEKVLNAIEKCRAQQPRHIQLIFDRLKDYTNIPNKKPKFESFLKSSLRVFDSRLATQIWETIDRNIEKQPPVNTSQQNGKGVNSGNETTSDKPCERLTDIENKSDQPVESIVGERKLNKRERKEERQKQNKKKQKKEISCEKMNGDDSENCHTKKKKKKKYKENDEEEKEEKVGGKKRKLDDIEENGEVVSENVQPADEDGDQSILEENGEPAKKRFKTKFDWSGVITEVLSGKDSEIKIKKLRKKVLAEYLSQGCTEKSEEKLWAKFDKKLKKNPLIKIQNDRVKLKKK